MIPASSVFDQSTIARLLDHDPLVQQYRAFFSLLDWSVVDAWEQRRSARGRPLSHPTSTYLKAFLLRIHQGLQYFTHLRSFLLHHPLLIIEFGFELVLDPHAPYGFDADKTLPCRYWFGEKLHTLDPDLLQDLLRSTVLTLQEQIPGLGDTVAFDVKHIYAWVQENNPRVAIKDRFDKDRQPPGDPDCKVGVKRSTNIEQPDGSAKVKKEYLWGSGSGVAAATVVDYGDVVLAEYTQPFNQNDITFYRPLYQSTVVALNSFPLHSTADAAFDAWYVYDDMARHGGIAAVPLNQHGHPLVQRDPDGVPLCAKGLRMHPKFHHQHPNGYRAYRYGCPLLLPRPTGDFCDHEQFTKGVGCTKDINVEPGGMMRATLDRTNPLYKAIYTQRTCCERINSQSKELGIERPKLRNQRSITHLNTLIYVTINLRTLSRAISRNRGLLLIN